MLFSQDEVDRARDVEIAEKHGGKLKKEGPNLVGDCPFCGDGAPDNDRFIVWVKSNTWWCRGCGEKGDVIKFVMLRRRCSFVDAMEELIGRSADASRREPTPEEIARRKAREEQRHQDEAAEAARAAKNDRRAAEVVARLQPIVGTPGEVYLHEVRKIDVSHPAIRRVLESLDPLGWGDQVYVHETDPDEPLHQFHGQHLGAIVAILTDPVTAMPTGGITRTYLHDGHKIGKAKSLGGRGKLGIIRLTPDEEVLDGLHICEGIESALSWMMMGFIPMWAAGSTSTMESFPLLDGIECLTVMADNDEKGGGLKAARKVGQRWANAGREAIIYEQNEPGDINDIVRRET